MSSAPKGRGRGRGRGKAAPSEEPAPPRRSPSPPPPADDDETMQDADEDQLASSSPPKSKTRARVGTKASTSAAGGSKSRPVGGLLGESEYAKKPAAAPAAGKLKFVPNMKRKTRVVQDDEDYDDDVKMEDDFKSKRAPRPRAPRVEMEMTATGPMAQGPGGAPKGFGARTFQGAAGAGVMNASREGRLRGQYEEQLYDPDASDYEGSDAGDGGGLRIMAQELDLIGDEDEMAPITLPRDPSIIKAAEERRKKRQDKRIKDEAKPLVKPEPEDDAASAMLSSAAGTPALEVESKTVTSGSDSKEVTMEPEDSKDLKPELDADLSADFNLEYGAREQIYMFQFPRRFPNLVNESQLEAETAVKVENPDAAGTQGPRKKQPPEWGRFGPRANKAARWAGEEGQIGELVVRRSGKVELRINNDLTYEILPAARPSFLQEIAVLDHDPATVPRAPGVPSIPSDPSRAMVMMGQTGKKFMVVPEINGLLEKVDEQLKEEKRAEARAKSVKKEKKET
ncbi:RNA polymerase III RPC4-domain-containing protein [Leucosporidium creatinivorum]|uniref:RNA polymerase III RPC4-domain-containing protein n=1 Tax=Leucosporidium creatinivorum TaxID=106004 RepID=A0A1Y2ED20_9BASI|nr:RNA polymerase III RPC4-domain-containing protein [Leucosporidium creatinivorum]